MRTIAALLLLSATAAAGPLRVRVFATDEAGGEVEVSGARLLVRTAAEVLWPERDLAASVLVTERDGSLLVDRPDGAVIVVAGMALRGTAWARVPAGEAEVRLVLPPEAMLCGVVTGPEGKPVPGAEVLASPERPEDTGEFLSAGSVVFREVTDGEGRFTFYRLRADSRYRVRASAPGLAPTVRRDRPAGPDPVAVVLRQGATVRGLVIAAPGGAPVAGAEVEAGGVTARSGPDGRFELRGVPAGVRRLSIVSAGRRQVDTEELALVDGDIRVGIVIRVLGVARITGRVLAPSTGTVAEARILLRYPPDPGLSDRLPPDRIVEAGRSDADGNLDLRDLVPAQGVDVIAVHPLHAPTVFLGFSLTAGSTLDTVLLLRTGGAISGEVVDGEGKGVEGAEVLAVDDREDLSGLQAGLRPGGPTLRTARTGADGAFRLEHVAVGKRALVALAAGRRPAVLRGVLVADRSTRERVVLVAAEGAALAGRVEGPGGEPVSGATVRLRAAIGPEAVTSTAAGGTFRFEGLVPGAFELRVEAEGLAPFLASEVLAPAGDVRIRLETLAALSGRVVREGTAEPLAPAVVRALRREAPDSLAPERAVYRVVGERRAEPPDAAFSFDGLPPGTYRLEAFTEEGAFGFRDGVAVAAAGPPPVVEIGLYPGQTVSGRVISAVSGLPVEGATVAVRGPTQALGGLITAAGADGAFRLRGVPPGFHTILVTARDHAPALVDSVEVRPAADTWVRDVVLSGGAVVRGLVTGTDGEPRMGVEVRLASPDLGGTRTARTEADGTFLLSHLAAGNWLAEAEDPGAGAGGRRIQRLLTLRDGEEVFLALGTGEGGTLTGRILSGNEPIPFAPVRLLRLGTGLADDRQVLSTSTDAEGNYAFTDVLAGEFLLMVDLPGRVGAAVRVPLRLLPGPVTIRDVVLADSGIAGAVEDLDTGEPLPGARLVLAAGAAGAEGTFLERLTAELGEAVSGPDGTFRFPAVEAGIYRVSAFRPGYGQTVVEGIRVVPGGDTPVRIALPPAGELSGVVEDDSGRPVGHARILVFDARGGRATRETFVEVDSSGRFRIDCLRTGTYAVEVVAAGYGRERIERIEVFPGGTPEIRAVLRPEGRLLLTVYGPGGRPVAGARVALRDFWGRAVRIPDPPVGILVPWRDPTLTGEDGAATFPNLPPGIYEVTATAPGLAGEPVRVRVLDGEGSRAALVLLPPAPGK